MEKEALLGWVDKNRLADTAIQGGLVGAGSYATLALIREVLDALDDRKAEKKRRNPGINKDTIVVTLPASPKTASARDAIVEYAKIHKKKTPEDKEPQVRQARNSDGTFARGYDVTLSKSALDWGEAGNEAVNIATGLGSIGVGWYLTQKVHDYLKQKRLKREIAAAQQEYIDLLMPKEAQDASGYTPDMTGLKPVRAAAPANGDEQPGPATQFFGLAGGVALLLSAASTMLTKKFLDDRFKEPDAPQSANKVKKIVFKSASGDPLETTPVDVVAYAKAASIAFQMDFPKELEKKAQAEDYDYGNDVSGIFGDLERSGYDPSKLMTPGEDQQAIIDRLLRWSNFIDPTEGFQNEFMSDKYAKQREALARYAINDRLKGFNNSWFGKTWLGQGLSSVFGWLGRSILSNTPWGNRLLFNGVKDQVMGSVPKEFFGVPTAKLVRRLRYAQEHRYGRPVATTVPQEPEEGTPETAPAGPATAEGVPVPVTPAAPPSEVAPAQTPTAAPAGPATATGAQAPAVQPSGTPSTPQNPSQRRLPAWAQEKEEQQPAQDQDGTPAPGGTLPILR